MSIVGDCMALGALMIHACVRHALAGRSGGFEDADGGLGIDTGANHGMAATAAA